MEVGVCHSAEVVCELLKGEDCVAYLVCSGFRAAVPANSGDVGTGGEGVALLIFGFYVSFVVKFQDGDGGTCCGVNDNKIDDFLRN